MQKEKVPINYFDDKGGAILKIVLTLFETGIFRLVENDIFLVLSFIGFQKNF